MNVQQQLLQKGVINIAVLSNKIKQHFPTGSIQDQ